MDRGEQHGANEWKLKSTGSVGTNSGQEGRRWGRGKRWGAQVGGDSGKAGKVQLTFGLAHQAEEPLSWGNGEPWKD